MAKPKAKPARVEYNKILDRNDEKWAHPLVKDCYINSGRKTVEFLANPEASLEARIENKQKTYDSLCAAKAILDQIDPELAVHGTTVEYEIPGLSEEPEISTTRCSADAIINRKKPIRQFSTAAAVPLCLERRICVRLKKSAGIIMRLSLPRSSEVGLTHLIRRQLMIYMPGISG